MENFETRSEYLETHLSRGELLVDKGEFSSKEEADGFLQQLDGQFEQFSEGNEKVDDFKNDFTKILNEAEEQIKQIELLSPGQIVDREELFKDILSGIAENYQELKPVLSGMEAEKKFSLIEIPKKIGNFVREHKVALIGLGIFTLMSRVGFGIGSAEAGETHHGEASIEHLGIDDVTVDNTEHMFENVFHEDISHNQAEKIAAAYQFADENELKQILEMGSKLFSQSEFSEQQIVDFLTDSNFVQSAVKFLHGLKSEKVDQGKENDEVDKKWKEMSDKADKDWQESKSKIDHADIGKIVSTHEIKLPGHGKITITEGDKGFNIDTHAVVDKSNAYHLLNSDKIELTKEGEKAYAGRFVNDVQKELMLDRAVNILAGERSVLFQALEQAEKSGDQKAAELIQHQLDNQKQQCEKLYGHIFKK